MDNNFYSLDEAADKLGCEINDLLKRGVDEKIELCIWYEGPDHWTGKVPCFLSPPVGEYISISKEDIRRVYNRHNGSSTQSEVHNAVTLTPENKMFTFPAYVLGPFTLTTKTLFLSHANFASLKAELDKVPTKPASSGLEEDEKRISNLTDSDIADSKHLRIALDNPAQVVIGPATTRSTKTKPDLTMTQAVKQLFDYLLKTGETDALKKANILVFANKMKALIREKHPKDDTKNMETSKYLLERIEKVMITQNSFTVKTKEYQHHRKGGTFKIEKSASYNKQAIEKRLKPLREENSILD